MSIMDVFYVQYGRKKAWNLSYPVFRGIAKHPTATNKEVHAQNTDIHLYYVWLFSSNWRFFRKPQVIKQMFYRK
jgi:hypothetical protein